MNVVGTTFAPDLREAVRRARMRAHYLQCLQRGERIQYVLVHDGATVFAHLGGYAVGHGTGPGKAVVACQEHARATILAGRHQGTTIRRFGRWLYPPRRIEPALLEELTRDPA